MVTDRGGWRMVRERERGKVLMEWMELVLNRKPDWRCRGAGAGGSDPDEQHHNAFGRGRYFRIRAVERQRRERRGGGKEGDRLDEALMKRVARRVEVGMSRKPD